MYFGRRMTPLTSRIRGHLLWLILPHMVNHTCMSFPCPSASSLDPLDHFCPLMFPRPSLKTCENFYMRLLNLLSRIYVGLTSKTAYIGMCTKIQILLEFSLTWIWLTCLLAFHMPWDHSDLTFHYPFENLLRNPLVHWRHKRELRAKKL